MNSTIETSMFTLASQILLYNVEHAYSGFGGLGCRASGSKDCAEDPSMTGLASGAHLQVHDGLTITYP